MALPGGGATAAIGIVDAVEQSALLLVATLSDVALTELALLGGDLRGGPEKARFLAEDSYGSYVERVEKLPLPLRILRVQLDAVLALGEATLGAAAGLGNALINAPLAISAAVEKGGLMALPRGLATSGQQVVRAAATGVAGLISTVADIARAELLLVPGARDPRSAEVAKLVDERVEAPRESTGPAFVEFVVRLPIATLVAASELTVGVLRATTRLTGAVVNSVTDVAGAVFDNDPETTVPDAIARVPETLNAGVQRAGRDLQDSASRARERFVDTLTPGSRTTAAELAETSMVRASGGSGTTVNGTEVETLGTTVVDATGVTSGGVSSGTTPNGVEPTDNVEAVTANVGASDPTEPSEPGNNTVGGGEG
jgi:hypothetical protein